MVFPAFRALRAGNLRQLSRVTSLPRATVVTDRLSTNDGLFTEVPRESLQLKHKPRLAGRKFLPGSVSDGIPEFLASPTESFPYAVTATKPSRLTLKEWARECRSFIKENLFDKEAILLRNLPLSSAQNFLTFYAELGYTPMSYVAGGGNRTQVDAKSEVYTASDDPPEFCIEPHNELSYSPVYPQKLFLFCLTPPKQGCGGETPILRNRQLMARLDEEVMKKLEKKKLMYTRYCPDREVDDGGYMTWQQIFQTEDRKEAEHNLEKLGYEYSWHESGGVNFWYYLPAVTSHPVSGEKIFFNQITSLHSSYIKASPQWVEKQDVPDDMCPTHAKYGDGSEIEPAVLQHVRAVSWSCAVGFQWQQGDLLVLDNILVQHARLGFSGDRKMLACLAAD